MTIIFMLITYFTMLIDIVFLITLINLLLRAILFKKNYLKLVKDECSDIFSMMFGRALLIIVPLIIFSNIYCLIYESGANAQIGSFFEAESFIAKYEATVELDHSGDLPTKYSSLKSIDGKTVEATIFKGSVKMDTGYSEDYVGNDYEYTTDRTGYYVYCIQYQDFTLINDEEGDLVEANGGVSFHPCNILKNGKAINIDGDYPEYTVVLSDTLLEKLENLTQKDNSINSLYLVSYIIFLSLSVAYLLWVVNNRGKSPQSLYWVVNKRETPKKALIITAIISIAVSVCLIAFPISYIYLNN